MYLNYQERINRQMEALRQISEECQLAKDFFKQAATRLQEDDLRDVFQNLAQIHYDIEQQIEREISILANRINLMRSQLVLPDNPTTKKCRSWAIRGEFSLLKDAIQIEKSILKLFGLALEHTTLNSSAFVTLVQCRNKIRREINRLTHFLPILNTGSIVISDRLIVGDLNSWF